MLLLNEMSATALPLENAMLHVTGSGFLRHSEPRLIQIHQPCLVRINEIRKLITKICWLAHFDGREMAMISFLVCFSKLPRS